MIPRFVRLAALLCFAAIATQRPAGARDYTLGAVPFLPPQRLEAMFAPLASELGARLGGKVTIRFGESFDSFETRLRAGTFDLVFVHPFDYVEIAVPAGYRALAGRNARLWAQIVTREDGEVTDLAGITLALPPDRSAVSRLIRIHLHRQGLTGEGAPRLVYMRSHDSCLQSMLTRMADACAAAPILVDAFELRTGTRLRRLADTPSIPTAAFAVHRRIGASEQADIRTAIVDLQLRGIDPVLRQVFYPVRGVRGFAALDDADFDGLRELIRRHSPD